MGREAGSWNITLAFLWRPQSALCSWVFFFFEQCAGCDLYLQISPAGHLNEKMTSSSVIYFRGHLILVLILSDKHICTDPERWTCTLSHRWFRCSLQVPARSGQRVGWGERDFQLNNMSTLVGTAGTLSVRTRMHFVWVRITPLSRLDINHIFFAHSQSVMRFSLNQNVQTAPAELPTEPDEGLSDTERASNKRLNMRRVLLQNDAPSEYRIRKVFDFPMLLLTAQVQIIK